MFRWGLFEPILSIYFIFCEIYIKMLLFHQKSFQLFGKLKFIRTFASDLQVETERVRLYK